MLEFFLLDTLRITFSIANLIQRWKQSTPSFQNQGTRKGQGKTAPSCATETDPLFDSLFPLVFNFQPSMNKKVLLNVKKSSFESASVQKQPSGGVL